MSPPDGKMDNTVLSQIKTWQLGIAKTGTLMYFLAVGFYYKICPSIGSQQLHCM